MKRIVSRVKRKKIFIEKDGKIRIEKAVVIAEEEDSFMIFDTDDIDIVHNENQIEITMWFKNSRPWDRFYQLDMKPNKINIFLCRQAPTPILTFTLRNGFFRYMGFYNIIINGEVLQDRSYFNEIL